MKSADFPKQNICDASGPCVRPCLSGETVNFFWGRVLVYVLLLHGCNMARRPIFSITSSDKILNFVRTRLIYMKHRRRGSSVSIVIHLRFHSSREQKLLSSRLQSDRFWDSVFPCIECRWPCLRGAKAWNWPLSTSTTSTVSYVVTFWCVSKHIGVTVFYMTTF
jgi:hypothetical protein